MLFLISSAQDTKEFRTAYNLAKEMKSNICLLQNAVYAARNINDGSVYILNDDLMLRGIKQNEISGRPVDYGQLIDLITESDRVVGLF
jgi:sulfur relay protein TusB/DsrH